MSKYIIDIGHNCYPDIGASGVGDENTMNMEVGKKVISKLQALGHVVISVLPSSCSSVGNSLAQRVNKANSNGGDLYISIHFNAGGGRGSEVWCGSQSSVDVATKVLNELCNLGFKNREVRIQGQNGYEHLYVLNNTTMPSILVESCFVDTDDMNLYNAENIANAIVKGITGQSVNNTPTNGWYQDNNTWYYYQNNTKITNGWAKDSHEKWFYLGSDGLMIINGWVLYKGSNDTQAYWYYFGADGAMFESLWAYWDEDFYYLDKDGKMLINCKTPDGYTVLEDGEWDRKPATK